ncbi:MAG: Hpt domain-containing protein, partial [Magnetococcales bacterium]|nr:Hpt domain-containing protein [Magnetococcales bacterium]
GQGDKSEPEYSLTGESTLDMEKITELREDLEERFDAVIHSFQSGLTERLGTIHEAVQEEQAGRLVDAAHSLKGICAQFGLQRMRRLASALEVAGRSGNLQDGMRLIGQLQREAGLAREALQAFCKSSCEGRCR